MSTAALTVTIRRPVADVFAVLTHLENAATWSRAIEETVITPGPFGVGTLHEVSGGWNVPLLVLAGLSLPLLAVAWYVGKPAALEDQLRAPAPA